MSPTNVSANGKASLEKQNRLLNHQMNESNRRCEEANLTLTAYDTNRKKTMVGNVEVPKDGSSNDNNLPDSDNERHESFHGNY